MLKISRDDIHLISRHSNWSENGVDKTLKDQIYHPAEAWRKFLRLLFISLGVSFLTTGIIFFFAYNWYDLHKFVKIGLLEGMVIVLALVVLFSKIKSNIKDIMLTGTSILVGIMFAVYGQVYQTGANAYDFFWGWTLAISLWVVVSNFAPLWLVWLTLVNTTLILYSQQVAQGWSEVLLFTLLFSVNTSFLILGMLCSKFMADFKAPNWFLNLVALASVSCATLGIITGIFDHQGPSFWVLLFITAISFGIGLSYGFNRKKAFYLSIIPFSLIIIISALLVKVSSDAGMFFAISIFVVFSVSLLIKSLIDLQKKWTNA